MEPDPIKLLLAETSKRQERARVIENDLRAGFHQILITNTPLRSFENINMFSSPLPGVHAVDCPNCARFKLRLAELQAKVIEFEQEPTNAEQETKGSKSQSTK